MRKNNKTIFPFLGVGVSGLLMSSALHAGIPVWTYSAPNPITVAVGDGGTETVRYIVTNQSTKAKNLILKKTPGLSASACRLATKGSTCTLTLTINGSQISEKGLHSGPVLCEQGNTNQCYQPSAANVLNVNKNAVIQVSLSELALSVKGLTEYGIPTGSSTSSGRPRYLTITNTGTLAATNVGYTHTGLPSGTRVSPTSCGTIAPSGTCKLTITPGITPNAPAGTVNPTPITFTISGNNTNTVNSNVQILTYGSVYQGGYIFAFDDLRGCSSSSDCFGSVGGKVVTTTDQAAPYPNGIIWSSNGASGSCAAFPSPCDVSFDVIPGISETSSSIAGTPSYSNAEANFNTTYSNTDIFPFPLPSAFEQCDGRTDGGCNSRNIIGLYSTTYDGVDYITTNYQAAVPPPTPNFFALSQGMTSLSFYAAGLCQQLIGGFSLPAICEMGYTGVGSDADCGSSSSPKTQNIQSSLVDNGTPGAPSGGYWSSTEVAANSSNEAWGQLFSAINSGQSVTPKTVELGVRCIRGF